MSELLNRLKKATVVKESSDLASSTVINSLDTIPTPIPALNIAFSGRVDGGFTSGLTIFCGASATFKSAFALLCAKSYMDKYDDAVLIFYDSEMGASKAYFESMGIDLERVLHIPITDVEEFRFDIAKKLEDIQRGDHVMIVVDSIGNLASRKEVEDAINEKTSADMTRAKQLKGVCRMITPKLNLANIPCIFINHVYETMELYSKAVMSGGCVLAGTKIFKADGSLVNIEDVKVGDLVKTLVGDRKVLHTWNPETLFEGTPDCYEVTFEDGSKVTCSGEHKFLLAKTKAWVTVEYLMSHDCDSSLVTENGTTKITSIVAVGKKPVYDIRVEDAHHYILENGVASHNTGLYYSANQILHVTKAQEKNSTGQIGWNFNLNIMKSRFVREKSKIPVTVTYSNGIYKYSGLLEMALSSGNVVKPSNGWYQKVDTETGEVVGSKLREADTHSPEFWEDILEDDVFKDWVGKTFKIANSALVATAETELPDPEFTAD